MFESYEEIRRWKDEYLIGVRTDPNKLNQLHDQVMKHVLEIAVKKIAGEVPCSFEWFITGSGGRYEQGLISDQDHGFVFQQTDSQTTSYFLKLGQEVSDGLYIAGYPYCLGKVMASNPLWCKSLEEWKVQLFQWMEEESWESIRHLQIFYDARALTGTGQFVSELKDYIHQYKHEHPVLLKRLLENVMHLKSSIGPLGQILTIEKGKYSGCVDLKYSAFIPYVNAIRLLAMKEEIQETTTVDRMKVLLERDAYGKELVMYNQCFHNLLKYRASLLNEVEDYEDTHYLKIKQLNKEERREIKKILKNAKSIHQYVANMIEKGV